MLLILQCDGSADRLTWGTGVYIPDVDRCAILGGANDGLGVMQERDGSCDLAVAEILAFVYAAFHAAVAPKQYDELQIICASTTVWSNLRSPPRALAPLEAAVCLLKQALVKLLRRYPIVNVVHKDIQGHGNHWRPRMAALEGQRTKNAVWNVQYYNTVELLEYHVQQWNRQRNCIHRLAITLYTDFGDIWKYPFPMATTPCAVCGLLGTQMCSYCDACYCSMCGGMSDTFCVLCDHSIFF